MKISIIGAGFGALTAVRSLRKRNKNAEITLIAPKAEFLYYPSLIWLPARLRKPEDLRIDLRKFLDKHQVKFHAGKVTGIEDGGRTVVTDNGNVQNDGLIIASGGRFIKKLPGIEHALTLCEGIEPTMRITNGLDDLDGGVIAVGFGGNPKEPSAMRGGPMFELLFGIDTLLHKQKRRGNFEIVFFNPAPQPGKRLGEKAVTGLLEEMQRRDIKTHLGHKIKGFESNKVMTEGGEFDADMILFMPGMTGPAWLPDTDLPKSPGGMIQANAHCKVEGFEKTYVAGDSGSFPGPDWMPKQAHMADLQADTAVANLLAEFKGFLADRTFKVELICIVDTLDKGILVYRDIKRTVVLPSSKFFHYMKQLFEKIYIYRFR